MRLPLTTIEVFVAIPSDRPNQVVVSIAPLSQPRRTINSWLFFIGPIPIEVSKGIAILDPPPKNELL